MESLFTLELTGDELMYLYALVTTEGPDEEDSELVQKIKEALTTVENMGGC